MSVLLESQKGDVIICIEEFHATPSGVPFSWDKSRRFRVGERLKYIGCQQDPKFKDHPNEWMIEYEADDGQCYVAVNNYFVTEECWHGIAKFFAKRVLRQPKAKPAATKHPK